jgi:hypothetical protein
MIFIIFIIILIVFLFKKKNKTKQHYKHNLIDIHTKINKYKHKNQETKQKNKLLWELYFTYFNGILDKYDEYGNIIEKGIEPNTFKMFEILDTLESIPSEQKKVYLEKAKLYEQGFHNFPPCEELSIKYYHLLGIHKPKQQPETQLPQRPIQIIEIPIQRQRPIPRPRQEININQIHRHNERNLYNDPQNVHDTVIMDKMKEISETLIPSETNQYNNIIKEINNRLQHKKRDNAIKVLDTMYSSNGYVSKYNKNEVDIISDTFNTIKNTNNDDYMNMFCEELSSGVEWGNVVCTVGRANRVLNSLTCVENTNTNTNQTETINLDTLRPEMLTKASKLYTDNIDKDTDEIKHIITNELLQDYNHIDKNKVETEINSWINDIF